MPVMGDNSDQVLHDFIVGERKANVILRLRVDLDLAVH